MKTKYHASEIMKAILLSFLVLAAITQLSIAAEPEKVTGAKLIPATLDGTILAVNKDARQISVQIKDTQLKINVTDQVKISKEGKGAAFAELAAGQAITLSFMEMPNSKLEVASLVVRR